MGASNGNASTRCPCASPTERKACAERRCHLRGDAGRCAAAAGTGNQAESGDSGGGGRCGRAAVCSIRYPWQQRHQRVFAPCRLRQGPARGMSRPLPSSRPPPAAGRAPTSARSSPRTRPGSTIPVESQMTRQLASIKFFEKAIGWVAIIIVMLFLVGFSTATSATPEAFHGSFSTVQNGQVQISIGRAGSSCPLYYRNHLCYRIPTEVVVARLLPPAKELWKFDLYLGIFLSPSSTNIGLSLSVSDIHSSGSSLGTPNLRISGGCSTCSPSSQVIANSSITAIAGTVTTSVPVSFNQVVHPDLQLHTTSYLSGFSVPGPTSVSLPMVVRCDHLSQLGNYPGCVIPAFIPEVDLSGLPTISKNIAQVQNRGSHLGQPGSGNPLYRNSGGAEKAYNRQISCPKALKRPTGYECDEYPFASTTMGGGKAAPADRYVGWVPAAENHLQGGLLSTFFSTDRVFPAFTYGGQGDPFYVYV